MKFYSNFGYYKPAFKTYQNPWNTHLTKSNFTFPPRESTDFPCDFTPKRSKTANSKPSDLIVGCVFENITGLIPFLRTFRTISCKATFVLLVDDEVISKLPQLTQQTDIIVINTGKFFRTKKAERYQFKVAPIEFVLGFGHFFDRIIITDIVDVILQGDPFQNNLDWSQVSFTFEAFYLFQERTNKKWVKWFPMWKLTTAFRSRELNTGLIAGYSKIMVEMCRLILYYLNAPEYHKNVNDQTAVNHMILSHFIEDAGIPYDSRVRNQLGVFCMKQFPAVLSFPDQISSGEDTYTLLFHKYKDVESSLQNLTKLCHLEDNSTIRLEY